MDKKSPTFKFKSEMDLNADKVEMFDVNITQIIESKNDEIEEIKNLHKIDLEKAI